MSTIKKLSVLIFALILVACNGNGTEEAASVPTSTLAPLFSLTPRLTATPFATRTPLPTFTPIPSETPTPSDTPIPSPTPPIIGIVNSINTVNLREGPSTRFSPIRALVPGTGVEVLAANPEGDWYNVQVEDGTEGWIFARLLRLESTPTPFPTPTPTPNETELAAGGPLPTSVLGGGTVTPTPPGSGDTATPPSTLSAEDAEETESFLPIIDVDAINQTATALAAGVLPVTPAPAVTGQSPNSAQATAPATATRPRTSSSGATVQEGADVFAMCNNTSFGAPAPTNLAAGSTIDVYWAWYVAAPSFMQQHLDAVNYEVRVNDTLLSDWQQYGMRTIQAGDSYAKFWYVPFGPLEAGDYEITYRATWSERITDGYENFGPGTNNPIEQGSCSFTVHP